jgi:1-deoxy-D-xylulose-5-phosphate reductoisomerase
MQKQLLILGSTGSIGTNTLKIVDEHPEQFNVKTIIANSNIEVLAQQAIKYNVDNVGIADDAKYLMLKKLLAHHPHIKVMAGKSGINELLQETYDVTIAAIMGIACLEPIMTVMPNTKIIGMANKESIVCAGQLLLDHAKKHYVKIIPLDSEHNAIFQVLDQHNLDKIERVILTASGGPFYQRNITDMQNITPAEAINHPIWKMGPKISVDSATLMNKGLELIEAHYLFDIKPNKLEAVIHPQSIVHGLITYSDGSTLAQMASADMRTPISLALNYPKRLAIKNKMLSWTQLSSMRFFEPDEKQFPCLKLAKMAIEAGQSHCIMLNIANELAVDAFLTKRIGFVDIPIVIEKALDSFLTSKIESIQDVFDIVVAARKKTNTIIS